MSTYKYQTGDHFYHSGPFAVYISPDGTQKQVEVFNPYSTNNTHVPPPPGWVKHVIAARQTPFCPQAAIRGQSDGDTRPGFVTNVPAGQPIHNITGVLRLGPDPYGQDDVYSSDGGNVTIPNIGWPK